MDISQIFLNHKSASYRKVNLLKELFRSSKKFFGCSLIIATLCLISLVAISVWLYFLPEPYFPPEVALPERPSISPSGNYELFVQETLGSDGNVFRFEIKDLNTGYIFQPDVHFASRHTTIFLWGEKDRVWIYSGDTGTTFWDLSRDGISWERFNYDEDNPAPPYLKEERPKHHPW